MLPWKKSSLAMVLGLMMSLTLLTSGTFAQNVHQSQTSTTAQMAIGSTLARGMNQTLPFAQTHPVNHQRASSWNQRSNSSITCAVHYKAYRVYQHGRWVYVCRRY